MADLPFLGVFAGLSRETLVFIEPQTLAFEPISGAVQSFLGMSFAEFSSRKSLSKILAPEDYDLSVEVFSNFLFGDTVSNFRTRLLHKDGHRVVGSWTAQFKDGKWNAVLTNITELIQIESVFQAERLRYDTILESVSEVVFQIDADGRCVFVNKAASDVLGHAPNELLWREFLGFLKVTTEEARILGRALSVDRKLTPESADFGSGSLLNFELTHTKPSGEHVHLSLNLRPLFGGDGMVVGKVGTIRDVTQLKRQQSDLMQASKLMSLGEMAAGIAHEINNPLAIIIGRAAQLRSTLEEGNVDKAGTARILDSIENTGQRIAKIVKGLRTFSRNADSDPFVETDLSALVDDTLAFCRERFKQHGVTLSVEGMESPKVVNCRPTQISQALLNLLNNAYDAVEGAKEKWIKLVLTVQEKTMSLRVMDSGPGIPKDIRDKILQPFFTTKDVGKGTGLGLSIVRGIMESHGGSLVLETDVAHTCFLISLPRGK